MHYTYLLSVMFLTLQSLTWHHLYAYHLNWMWPLIQLYSIQSYLFLIPNNILLIFRYAQTSSLVIQNTSYCFRLYLQIFKMIYLTRIFWNKIMAFFDNNLWFRLIRQPGLGTTHYGNIIRDGIYSAPDISVYTGKHSRYIPRYM